jgi:hypothetical protein
MNTFDGLRNFLATLLPARNRRQRRAARRGDLRRVEFLDDRRVLNAAPVLVHNSGLLITNASSLVITSSQLQATDADNTAAQLVYTVTQATAHGSLKLNGTALGVGGTFTQQNVDDGKLTYVHGSGFATDGFQFVLTDGPTASAVNRVSISTAAIQGNNSSNRPAISADGRYVAFESIASNLVTGDTNGVSDIFVRDRLTNTTTRVSVDSAENQASGASYEPSISADGRYVAFSSVASNLAGGDANIVSDIFVRDLVAGTTVRASVDSGGADANGPSWAAAISADGKRVGFISAATDLVSGDTNGKSDVFVRNLAANATTRVSVDSSGVQANANSQDVALSSDGRYVAFGSEASNLVAGDTNSWQDAFVRDTLANTTTCVSVSASNGLSDGPSGDVSISDNGRFVAFASSASNLISGDTGVPEDVFLRDRLLNTTMRVSRGLGGATAGGSSYGPSISADARYIAFISTAPNLVSGDSSTSIDAFVYDRQKNATIRASVGTGGVEANGSSSYLALSGDGRFIAFDSLASNLTTGDTNATSDVFVNDVRGVLAGTTTIAINHAPVLDATKSPALTTIAEDAAAPVGKVGTLVTALVHLSGSLTNVADADAGATTGIAVIGTAAQGVWYYSLNDGGTWTTMNAVGNSGARLLAADGVTRLYFKPNANFNGPLSSALTFRAWDRTSGANGGFVTTTINGGTSSFSSATDTASLTVAAVNDAPVLDVAKSPVLNSVAQDAGLPVGRVGTLIDGLVHLSGSLKNVTDVDAGALTGITVTAASTSGTWYYSTNNGTTWSLLGAPHTYSARLLAADGATRVYFKPNSGFQGTIAAALSFRAWDRTTGINGGLADVTAAGGTTAFSKYGDTASIVVV